MPFGEGGGGGASEVEVGAGRLLAGKGGGGGAKLVVHITGAFVELEAAPCVIVT